MRLGRWATLLTGSLLAVSAIAMTGNAAYADEPSTLDVKGADTIVPGTPYDAQFVFTNNKAVDVSKGEFVFVLANFDASADNAKPTTSFKASEVSVEYKTGGTWKKVELVGEDQSNSLFGLLGTLAPGGPSATDDKAKTATYEFRITLNAPTKLSKLSLLGALGAADSGETALLRKAAATPKLKAHATETSDWADGLKVVTVKAPAASPTPTTPANAGGGGSLPTTGASTGLLAAAGALLIVAGGAVTVATRRRRTAAGRHAG